MYNYLKVEQVGTSLWAKVFNPPMNFMTIEMMAELYDVVRKAGKDDSIRVFILTGGMENNYIAHFDIPELHQLSLELTAMTEEESDLGVPFFEDLNSRMDESPEIEEQLLKEFMKSENLSIKLGILMRRLYNAIERMSKITIAAINGPCNGGGTEISYCFDFRFMVGDQGFTIGQPEVLVGIIAGGGGTQRLPRLIGKAKALEVMLCGNQISTEEAKKLGLITDTFNKSEFAEKVQEFADVMAKRAPIAVDACKKCVHFGDSATLQQGLSFELGQSTRLFRTRDARQGLHDYAEFIRQNLASLKEEQVDASVVGQITNAITQMLANSELTTFKGE